MVKGFLFLCAAWGGSGVLVVSIFNIWWWTHVIFFASWWLISMLSTPKASSKSYTLHCPCEPPKRGFQNPFKWWWGGQCGGGHKWTKNKNKRREKETKKRQRQKMCRKKLGTELSPSPPHETPSDPQSAEKLKFVSIFGQIQNWNCHPMGRTRALCCAAIDGGAALRYFEFPGPTRHPATKHTRAQLCIGYKYTSTLIC